MPIDPKTVLREARELTERGAYQEALANYRWFDQNALKTDPSLCGVRGSLAFRRWAELGNLYAPARIELESTRDARAQALRDGSLDVDLFRDVESMNDALDQIELTRDLFAQIARVNLNFARTCFSSAIAALVYTRDFSLARDFISSPREFLDRSMRELQFNLADLPTPLRESSARIKEAFVGLYAEDLFRVLSILVGVGEIDEARSLCTESLAGIADLVLRGEIRDQLRRFGVGSNMDFLVAE
jgi:hypothetical protein